MLVIYLFIIFLLLTVFVYFLFDKDIIAPPVIFCGMYMLSVGFSITEWQQWQMYDYSLEAFQIYVWGAIIFITIGFLIKKLSLLKFTNIDNDKPINKIGLLYINTNNWFLIVIYIMDIIIIILLLKNIKELTGGGNFSQMLETFRIETSYSTQYTLPGYMDQLSKIITSSAYVCGFILINNFLKIKKINLKLLIPVILYIIYCICNSNRLQILELFGAMTIYFCLLYEIIYKNKYQSTRLIFKIILILILILILFYSIRLLIGRSDSEKTGFSEYLATYIGGPVKLFDLYIKNPVKSQFWGRETFYSLLKNLRALGLINISPYIVHKEFRYINGINLGNVYSAYRPWLADFGLKGMIVLQILFSVFFNSYYFLIKKIKYNFHPLMTILYGYIATPVFLHPIDDEFYKLDFAIGFIIYLIVFYIIYKILTTRFIIKV